MAWSNGPHLMMLCETVFDPISQLFHIFRFDLKRMSATGFTILHTQVFEEVSVREA